MIDLEKIEERARLGLEGVESEGGGPSGEARFTCAIDVPDLVAEVRRLRGEVLAWKARWSDLEWELRRSSPSGARSNSDPLEGGPGVDLDAIEERAQKTTPGPWTSVGGTIEYVRHYPHGEETEILADCDFYRGREQSAVDAEFIAAARSDIPALVVEVRRLRKVLAPTDEPR